VDDVDSIVEILAKPLVLDHLFELAVRRGDEADVDRHLALGADRPDLALLNRAQELGLERQRHLADLVEKQRSTARLLEQTLPR
jgi:hypothetical protein